MFCQVIDDVAKLLIIPNRYTLGCGISLHLKLKFLYAVKREDKTYLYPLQWALSDFFVCLFVLIVYYLLKQSFCSCFPS